MKKTLYLSHILAAVVACSFIPHALAVDIVLEGAQTQYIEPGETGTIYVTGLRNSLMADGAKDVTFAFQSPAIIENGDLKLRNVKISPHKEDDYWEMGYKSRLDLGGSEASLVWFNITGLN